jgi:DNA-binding response OmpR family regulator
MHPDSQRGSPAAKILVVDDEPDVVEVLTLWMEDASYKVFSTTQPTEALRLFFEHRPDLTIVDIRMPGMDGFQVIGRLRELSEHAILVLSALTSEESIVKGLNLGADEYLTKPVSREIFLARVASLLRRIQRSKAETPATYGDTVLSIDYATREVRVRGEEVHLRPLEFRLLTTLVQNQDRMLTYEEILDRVWGAGEGSLDSLKWYVSSLRRKVEVDPQDPWLIRNVRMAGYRYFKPTAQPQAAAQ